jgi:protocatechuate 3,4-dioxygenase beta subunit
VACFNFHFIFKKNMNRKEFLQGMGLVGASTLLPGSEISRATQRMTTSVPPECVLIPSETAGPFPLDLSANTFYFRQDVREDRTGVLHRIKLKIFGTQNCLPMPNVRVNIWHCDKDGNYSGYGNQQGLTYLRGYQITDANGEVNFLTIFPGWYNGRICHVHFQVYVSSVYSAISQFSYPIEAKNALYAVNPTLYTKGADPKTFASDNIFSDGYAYQLTNLELAADGAYDSYLEVSVNASGTSALEKAEPETGGQFKLGQNFPNPFQLRTTVPLTLLNAADVQLEVWDLGGKKLATIQRPRLSAGEHQIEVDLAELGLSVGTYAYQLVATNAHGTFRQSKVMTQG